MSINEIINQNLAIKNLKLPKLTTRITHCQNQHYDYCKECKHHTHKKCNEKLIFQKIKQINNDRWHLYFLCGEKHLVIRWVIKNKNKINVGNLKN